MTRDLVLLGCTGSIGTQTLDVVARNPGFRVVGLAASGRRPDPLAAQVRRHRPDAVAVSDPAAAPAVQAALADVDPAPKLLVGPDAATELAGWSADLVLNAITGSIGLLPTLAALEAGRPLALANKESLIVGGPLVKARARPGQLVPVDSEHSALAQCLRAGAPTEVRRLVLTASGGPFRGWPKERLRDVTPEQALAHPTWDMGPVITVNSATLVNKGLELIEAHLLFDLPLTSIDVVLHPQSIVHSMVEFVDGSTVAQASPPDMRLPISLALDWPHRVPDAAPALTFDTAQTWQFLPLDDEEFPAVPLARAVGSAGGTAPAVFNAANEEAVAAFLAGRLPFPRIVETIAAVVAEHEPLAGATLSVEDVLQAEQWARTRARELAR